VVIDQPPELISHWAAASLRFARLYGGCILGFIDAKEVTDGARCDGDAFWAGATEKTPLESDAALTATGTAAQHAELHPDVQ
jgi:hypothetical protein